MNFVREKIGLPKPPAPQVSTESAFYERRFARATPPRRPSSHLPWFQFALEKMEGLNNYVSSGILYSPRGATLMKCRSVNQRAMFQPQGSQVVVGEPTQDLATFPRADVESLKKDSKVFSGPEFKDMEAGQAAIASAASWGYTCLPPSGAPIGTWCPNPYPSSGTSQWCCRGSLPSSQTPLSCPGPTGN